MFGLGDRHDPGNHRARGRQVHITVAREEGGKPFALAIPDWLFKVAVGLVGVVAMLIIAGGVLTARMGADLRRLHEIEEENAALRVENRKIEALAQELRALDALRSQILEIAGAKPGESAAAGDRAGEKEGAAGERRAEAERRAIAEAERRAAAALRRSVPAVPTPLIPASMRKALAKRGGAVPGLATGGAAPVIASTPQGKLPSRWPVEGVISKEFRINTTPDREHHGIDIAAPHGTPVHAAGAGIVARAEMDSVFGLIIVIDHGDGWQTVYGHNSRLVVGIGDSVATGQQIARVGSTGESSASHVHFEVRRGGRPVDPRRYVDR